MSQYHWQREAKSLAPDGNPCTSHSAGLLRRTPLTAAGFRYIGKETDRRWEQGEDFSLLDPLVLEYYPNETARGWSRIRCSSTTLAGVYPGPCEGGWGEQ